MAAKRFQEEAHMSLDELKVEHFRQLSKSRNLEEYRRELSAILNSLFYNHNKDAQIDLDQIESIQKKVNKLRQEEESRPKVQCSPMPRTIRVVKWSIVPYIEKQFIDYYEKWSEEIKFSSSASDMYMNIYYQRIIGLGPGVVPVLLRELEQRPNHWFWALHAITGENPVKVEQQGNMASMAEAWIRWGRNNGYEW